ncbi:hypothetical protein [Fulvimarina sp. MAC3]|uniref:hypothetical protein n=1 Tax=Fulvimarina sp. MAC3 TaxID=3148887 RepID=UPI0031FE074E
MRPQSLREVAERTRGDPDWDHHLREFLDQFYGADGEIKRQYEMIAEDPGFVENTRCDAFLGGVGEHLARRWRLPGIPRWVRHERRYLDIPMFYPDDPTVRRFLIAVAPAAFRVRLIFTGPDPLQRARFPYHRGVIEFPVR